jgi:hypothetical protein
MAGPLAHGYCVFVDTFEFFLGIISPFHLSDGNLAVDLPVESQDSERSCHVRLAEAELR